MTVRFPSAHGSSWEVHRAAQGRLPTLAEGPRDPLRSVYMGFSRSRRYPTVLALVGYEVSLYHIPQELILWDTMTALTTAHEKALTLLFAELEGTAEEQREAFLGTPGNLTQRVNEGGTEFWVHRYSDAVGRRQEVYLGTDDD